MEVDTSRHVKRKRSPGNFSLKKRQAYMVDGSQVEHCSASNGPVSNREKVRSEIRLLYDAFDVLSIRAPAADPERRKACVDVIINSVTGTLAAKRLAARLIPRFAWEFPDRVPRAVDCLLDVLMVSSEETPQQHRKVVDELRRDALEGLGEACDQAIKCIQRPEQLLGKVVHCLLRQLVHPHYPPHCGPLVNGGSTHGNEYNLIISSVEKAFRNAPQEVIAECLHAWRDGDAACAAGATIVFEKVLLDEHELASGGYGARRFGHSNGGRCCLAEDVLSNSPEAMQWTMEAGYGMIQEAGHCWRGHHSLLNSLLQKLSPYYQKHMPKSTDLRHRVGQSGHRHTSLCAPSGHPPHLQSRFSKADANVIPRPPHDIMYTSQWQNDNAPFLSCPAPPPQDDGPCLWFAALPNSLRKENLAPICSQYGTVNAIIFPPAPCQDKALVVFGSAREASVCCHHMLSNPNLSGGRHICATVPAVGNPCRVRDPISSCVWVGGVPSQARERDLLNSLRSRNLPPPRHLIVVKGVCPGYLLELQFLNMVTRVLDCLEAIGGHPYEPDMAQVPVNPSQMDLTCRPPLPRHQDEVWKLARGDPKPYLPPGTWGTQDTGDASHSSRPLAHPRPQIPQPPPPYPESIPASSPVPRPPPLPAGPEGSRGAWSGRDNGMSDAHHDRHEGHVRDMQSPMRRPCWSGGLAKSGEMLCKVVCWDRSDSHRWRAESQEAKEWPDVLDVRLRVDLNVALKTEAERVLLKLSARDDPADREGLRRFIQYLMDRTRAGVVHLRSGDRTLYLIPPTEAAVQMLDIDIGSRDSLIVVAVPSSGRSRR